MHQWQVAQVGKIVSQSDPRSTLGTICSANAASALGSKGAWAQVGSITPYKYEALIVSAVGSRAANYLMDIGVGSSTAVFPIIENMPVPSGLGASEGAHGVLLPVHVPLSSTMFVRCAATVSAATLAVFINGLTTGLYGMPGFAKGLTLGILSSTTLGSSIDAGGTANTKGALIVVCSAAPGPAKMALGFIGNGGDVARNAQLMLLDVVVNSQTALPNFMFAAGGTGEVPQPWATPLFPISVNSGDRISARTQASVTTAGDRVIDFSLMVFN